MIETIKSEAKTRMVKSLEAYKQELSKMRTGRANAGMLEHVTVDYYGSITPLSQVASVNVSDSRTLMVTPWEKAMVPAVEKAILNADLGLNPATAGSSIRVPMPALTEDRRRDLTKFVRGEGENAKVAIRNIRRDANAQLKDLLKDKEITEDESRKTEDQIQKLTDGYIEEIDKATAQKEADIMEV